MALAVWPAERRAYHYPGGAFALDRLAWANTLEHQEKPLAFVRTLLGRQGKALVPAYGHLPLRDADTVAVGHPVGYFQDALEHDKPGGDEPLATAVTLHTARQAVYHDPARPSAVLLPVTGGG